MEIVRKQKYVEHPMEDVFDIEPGTTLVEYNEVLPAEVQPATNYDSKDHEIEEQLETIFATAMSTVTDMNDAMEQVEGRHKARVGEVSATMLTVALNAVREKAAIKMHKDKTYGSKTSGVGNVTGDVTVNNNVIVADRNEILRAFAKKKP
jgi:hypothetical protein